MNTKISEIVGILKREGQSEAEINEVLKGIANAATVKFKSELMVNFTDEDYAAIDSCSDQAQADFEVKKRFAERTGKNPEVVMDEIMTAFAEGFLQKYNEDKGLLANS